SQKLLSCISCRSCSWQRRKAPCHPWLLPWFRMTGPTPSRQQTRKSEQQGEFASFVPSNKSDVEMGLGRQLTANTCPHATHGQLESCGSRLRQSDNGYFPGVSKIAEHAFTVIDSAARTCGIYCCGVRTPPANRASGNGFRPQKAGRQPFAQKMTGAERAHVGTLDIMRSRLRRPSRKGDVIHVARKICCRCDRIRRSSCSNRWRPD